jgi:hypothetical protein
MTLEELVALCKGDDNQDPIITDADTYRLCPESNRLIVDGSCDEESDGTYYADDLIIQIVPHDGFDLWHREHTVAGDKAWVGPVRCKNFDELHTWIYEL